MTTYAATNADPVAALYAEITAVSSDIAERIAQVNQRGKVSNRPYVIEAVRARLWADFRDRAAAGAIGTRRVAPCKTAGSAEAEGKSMPGTAKVRVTVCDHTYPAHPQRPCTAWIGEAVGQARKVAVGGTVVRRLVSGSVAVAAAVSRRAAESMDGVHRCQRMHDHAAEHGTRHQCACSFEWTDAPSAT